jgi:hypothetical protein
MKPVFKAFSGIGDQRMKSQSCQGRKMVGFLGFKGTKGKASASTQPRRKDRSKARAKPLPGYKKRPKR